MIKVLVADDHQIVTDGFLAIFKSVEDIHIVATARNGQEVLRILAEESVDVILMDINMPVLNGFETCKQVRADYPNIKVITLSMHKKQSFVKRMLQFGASGYVLKDDPSSEIIEAIRQVYGGKNYFSPRVVEVVMSFDLSDSGMNKSSVSDREIEVLQFISQGYTNQEIAEKMILSPHTTETHRRNLLLKLDARNTAELVRKGIEQGLI